MKRLLPLLLVFSLLAGGAGCFGAPPVSLRVAVLLPLSGPDYRDYKLPLEWALENINSPNVSGKKLELVYYDLAQVDLAETTRAIAEDNSILAVIGPDSSERAYDVAAALSAAKKVMITPSATSADIFRAFSRYKTVWRTVESDIAQVRTMLTIAARDGAKKVALVTSDEYYGATFFDWFGFFATELGLEVTDTVRYTTSPDTRTGSLNTALSHQPDALLAVPVDVDTALLMARLWKSSGSATRLIFSDAGDAPHLAQSLGGDADGIEGIELSADLDSGFISAFQGRFARPPTPYSANLYDALCLVAYGLERSGGAGGIKLADSLTEVVEARGQDTGWDKPELASAFGMIRSGNLPDVSGATGPLDFDKDSHTEITSSTYEHWRIEKGGYEAVEYFNTGNSTTAINGLSAFRALASGQHMQSLTGETYQPEAKTGLWALIVATSKGWDNYRHQADALAQYQLLRKNGVADDHIVLILADDIAQNVNNPEPGTIRNSPGGENLYSDVHIDYRLDEIDAAKLLSILAGVKSPELPEVIASGPGDNIYCFIVGHGNESGIYLGLENAIPVSGSPVSILTPASLKQAVSAMHHKNLYRCMFISVESCHGGVMGAALDAPGVMLMAGANQHENSLGANYDAQSRIWMADSFAYRLVSLEATRPGISMSELYEELYLNVNGSHVSAFAPAFGDADEVNIKEFIMP